MTSAALLTREEIVRGLVDQGVPRDRAEAVADAECSRLRTNERYDDLTTGIPPDPVAIELPLGLVLPWSALVSDNRKYAPTQRRQANGDSHALMILRQEYRDAKAKARSIARDAIPVGAEPITTPIALHARVWVPDRRTHDVCNFTKCLQDALAGVVYANDSQLWQNHWERAGVDVDRPRAEITITPIQE